MNLFSIADAVEAFLKRIRIDQTLVAIRFVVLGGLSVSLLRHTCPHPVLIWSMVAAWACLAYVLFGRRRLHESNISPDNRMIAAVDYFWRAATFCLALLLLAWSGCHRSNNWCFLLIALVLCTNDFGSILFVRWFRWHLPP